MHCKNCEQSIKEHHHYCPDCGQKVIDKLSVGYLFSNFINNYLSFDARFFKSLIPLIFKPGHLAISFVNGKRMKYMHPVQFYLFFSIILFFLLAILTIDQRDRFDRIMQEGFDKVEFVDSAQMNLEKETNIGLTFTFEEQKLDSLIKIEAAREERLEILGYKKNDSKIKRYFYSQILSVYEQSGKGILKAFMDAIPYALFLLLPLFALLLKLLFYKKIKYPEHLVFSFYFFSFIFLLLSLYLALNSFFAIPIWIIVLLALPYLLFSIKRFYKKAIGESLYKTAILIVCNMILLIPLSMFIFIISVLIY